MSKRYVEIEIAENWNEIWYKWYIYFNAEIVRSKRLNRIKFKIDKVFSFEEMIHDYLWWWRLQQAEKEIRLMQTELK